MAFPFTHTLVTFNWTTALGERGQTGLRWNRDTLPTQSEMNGLHSAFGIMWGAANTRINVEFTFTGCKAALIQPNGKYPTNSSPMYSTGSAVPGATTSGPYYPLQVATVATLLTTQLRGRASKGRLYLPPIAALLDASNFRYPGTRLNERGATVAAMISGCNSVMGGLAQVMSRVGDGETHSITGVKVGNRADVQRSRDNAVPETYGTKSAVTP